MKKLALLIGSLGLNLNLVISGCTTGTSTQVKEDYNTLDLTQVGGELIGDDPKTMTLAIFGNQEPREGNFTEEITVQDGDAFEKFVTLSQVGLADDSVRGFRYLLEFEFDQSLGKWRLLWAGRQQSCYRGDSPQAWTKEPCP